MAFNEMHRVPDRPLEPIEKKYVPAMGYEDEKALLLEFIKDHCDSFVEYVEDLDSTILWDFAESVRWSWNQYKEDKREYF